MGVDLLDRLDQSVKYAYQVLFGMVLAELQLRDRLDELFDLLFYFFL